MIVSSFEKSIRLTTQHDHARVSGTIARNWKGNHIVPEVNQLLKDSTFFAIDNHDVGWYDLDLNPILDRNIQMPFSFFSTTPENVVGLWEESIKICERFSAFSGYLVSMHFYRLAKVGMDDAPESQFKTLNNFVYQEENRQRELKKRMREIENLHKESLTELLRFSDTLSLLLCRAPEITPKPNVITSLLKGSVKVKINENLEKMEISPWPFVEDSLLIRIPSLTIPKIKFESDEDLQDAISLGKISIYETLIEPIIV